VSKLILQMQMSVDGKVASDTDIAWTVWDWVSPCPWDVELKKDFNAIVGSAGGILLSRKMIEQGYLDHWTRVGESHMGDPFYDFARHIAKVPKYVVTDKLNHSRWPRTQIIGGVFANAIRELKHQQRGQLTCFGGAHFGASLLSAGLVDELQLFINPAYVGEGLSLFGAPGLLTLMNSKAYACGIVVNSYVPQRDVTCK
jgi:dihydrofolate reductase